MKSHFTVEQFIHPSFRTPLGITLACARIAFAYAIAHTCLEMFALMPSILEHTRTQSLPFLDIFATIWSFSAWKPVLIFAGFFYAAGAWTRSSAGIFLVFISGLLFIERDIFFSMLDVWGGVALTLLVTTLFSRWGRVFGLDEFISRIPLFRKKNARKVL